MTSAPPAVRSRPLASARTYNRRCPVGNRPLRARLVVACTSLLIACVVGPAAAQFLPDRPIVLGDGRATISGDLAATTSCASEPGAGDCAADTGFFNYTDYDLSTLRMIRAGLSAAVRANRAVSVLGDLRFQNTETPRPYGLYVRVRPWEQRDVDIQAGLVPPTFGASARRAYANDNLLIGFPLGYQYLTSLRSDALPATADDLLRMRGRGWLSSFPLGNPLPTAGMPLVEVFRWDAGVQAHGGTSWIDGAASLTTGSLANPLFRDDNSGKHVSGRVSVRPLTGLVIGASGSRAPFATDAAAQAAGYTAGDFVQRALGLDVEYLARALPRTVRDGRQQLLDADDRQPSLGQGLVRRRPLQADAGSARRRPVRSHGIQHDHGVDRPEGVGGAGDALGGGGRLCLPAQSAGQGGLSAQRAAGRRSCAEPERVGGAAPLLVLRHGA